MSIEERLKVLELALENFDEKINNLITSVNAINTPLGTVEKPYTLFLTAKKLVERKMFLAYINEMGEEVCVALIAYDVRGYEVIIYFKKMSDFLHTEDRSYRNCSLSFKNDSNMKISLDLNGNLLENDYIIYNIEECIGKITSKDTLLKQCQTTA